MKKERNLLLKKVVTPRKDFRKVRAILTKSLMARYFFFPLLTSLG